MFHLYNIKLLKIFVLIFFIIKRTIIIIFIHKYICIVMTVVKVSILLVCRKNIRWIRNRVTTTIGKYNLILKNLTKYIEIYTWIIKSFLNFVFRYIFGKYYLYND